MKNIFFLAIALNLFFFPVPVLQAAQQQNDDRGNPAVDQARQDYRVFLEQLRQLNNQYRQVTGEVSKVLKEEGIPAIDEETGDLTVQHPSFGSASARQGSFGDVDVKETEQEIVVKMDLPGLNKEAIKVSIQDNKLLKIQGEREEEKETKQETGNVRYYRSERQRGSFERVVELPALVKDTGTEAHYDNGVLTVKIPKAEKPKKEVPVSVR